MLAWELLNIPELNRQGTGLDLFLKFARVAKNVREKPIWGCIFAALPRCSRANKRISVNLNQSVG